MNPWPLDEVPRPIDTKPTWHHLGGKINCFKHKGPQRRTHDLENQDAWQGLR
jgi:hypothetical protein